MDGIVINFWELQPKTILFLTLRVVIVAVIVVVIIVVIAAFRRGCGRCSGCGGAAQSGRRVIGGNGSLGGMRDLQFGTGTGTRAATCLGIIVAMAWFLVRSTIVVNIVIIVVLLRATYIACN